MIKTFFSLMFCFMTLIVHPVSAMELPAAPPPQLAANAWILMDAHSNQVLAEHNADLRIEPASLTKLVTAYLVFNAIAHGELKLSDAFLPSNNAWRTGGSRMFIEPNKPVTVDELLHGMIVQSGNDATVALAERVGGSEAGFISMMNAAAQQLGMRHSHFVTVNGLPDPQHYTTARDLGILAAAILRDFPQFSYLYSIKEYTYNHITQANRNRLLWTDPSVDGMKTGHTEAAGYCLIASAHRGDRRLISVVLGTTSDALRASESQTLLNYGFQFFDGVQLYAPNQAIKTLKVWKGKEAYMPVGFQHGLTLSVPHGRSKDLQTTLSTRQPLLAPLFAGQIIGTVAVSLDGHVLAQVPLQALRNDPAASWLGKIWDSIMLKFGGNTH
jgi:D-alanyl-D-alanine carboxypeptidase (penicillin-binding protein 5/6)